MELRRFVLMPLAVLLAVGALGACGEDDSLDPDEVLEDLGRVDLSEGSGGRGGAPDRIVGPVEIPEEVPLPDERDVDQAVGNPVDGYALNITSPTDPETLAEFYEEALEDGPWQEVGRQDTPAGDGEPARYDVAAAGPAGGDSILVRIRARDDGTTSILILTGPPRG